MARTGLYITDVKAARDALIAQGRHPSVDAVRVALGNTGSKTTIHKYLKELEAVDGGAPALGARLSEPLQALVSQLAGRLQEEAKEELERVTAAANEQAARQDKALQEAQGQAQALREQLQQAHALLHAEQTAHTGTQERSRELDVALATTRQRVTDLEQHLQDTQAQCASLEEKHQHAYQALEHYRQSVKEQREQDLRRHDEQIQGLQAQLRQAQQSLVVRQEELTRAAQQHSRMEAALEQAVRERDRTEETVNQLQQDLEAQADKVRQMSNLAPQLKDAQAKTRELTEKVEQEQAVGRAQLQALQTTLQETQLELAQERAKNEAQSGLARELHALIEARTRPGPTA